MIHEISHGRKFPDMLLNKTNYYQKLAIRKGEKKKKKRQQQQQQQQNTYILDCLYLRPAQHLKLLRVSLGVNDYKCI